MNPTKIIYKLNTPTFLNYKVLIVILFTTSLLIDILIRKSILFLPITLSTIITNALIKWAIPKLSEFNFHQIIRKDGPKEHLKKSKTPSIGGIIVIPIGLIIGYFTSTSYSLIDKEIIAIIFVTLGFMCIGFLDDWLSISSNKNTGLTAKQKIILQVIIGMIFLIFSYFNKIIDPNISLVGKSSINVGLFFIPLALISFLAESNATNITDGLDGLASGCAALVFSGLAIELILRGNNESYAFASFCMAMAGSWLGFLLQNRYPAKIFMGDTGSLAIGASLTGIALLSNTLWSLFLMGGIFLAESLSVIIQVGVFKATKYFQGQGYRIFLMAPIHHHFELKGKSEIQIVQRFWLISIVCIFVALKLRSNVI